MLRPIIISLFSVSIACAGCTGQKLSEQSADASSPNVAIPTQSSLKQDLVTLQPAQDLTEPQKLVIDVDSEGNRRRQRDLVHS
jgi:hypothetical protein